MVAVGEVVFDMDVLPLEGLVLFTEYSSTA